MFHQFNSLIQPNTLEFGYTQNNPFNKYSKSSYSNPGKFCEFLANIHCFKLQTKKENYLDKTYRSTFYGADLNPGITEGPFGQYQTLTRRSNIPSDFITDFKISNGRIAYLLRYESRMRIYTENMIATTADSDGQGWDGGIIQLPKEYEIAEINNIREGILLDSQTVGLQSKDETREFLNSQFRSHPDTKSAQIGKR
jgi:hypothetical protein